MKRQVFIVWFAIFIVWSFYRAYFNLPEWVDEYLIKPLIFLVPVLAIVWVWEDKKLKELGLSTKPLNFFLDVYIGVVLGVLFAVEGLVINYFKYRRFFFTPIESTI